jgi:hypothetical protein
MLKPPPPQTHGIAMDPEPISDLLVALPAGRREQDPRPHRQRVDRLAPLRPRLNSSRSSPLNWIRTAAGLGITMPSTAAQKLTPHDLEPDGAVAAGGYERPPVGAQGDGGGVPRVAHERRPELSPAGGVPEADRAILAG